MGYVLTTTKAKGIPELDFPLCWTVRAMLTFDDLKFDAKDLGVNPDALASAVHLAGEEAAAALKDYGLETKAVPALESLQRYFRHCSVWEIECARDAVIEAMNLSLTRGYLPEESDRVDVGRQELRDF